jgi:hypothetical protein
MLDRERKKGSAQLIILSIGEPGSADNAWRAPELAHESLLLGIEIDAHGG